MPQDSTSTGKNSWTENDRSGNDLIELEPFPKEFQVSIWENLDRRFTGVLLGSLLMNSLLVGYFLQNASLYIQDKHIAMVQQQFARLVLDKSEVTLATPETPAELLAPAATQEQMEQNTEATKAGRRGGRTSSGAGRTGASSGQAPAGTGRIGGSATRSRTDVGRAGILGLLSSSSSMSGGEAVDDILGEANVVSDMDKALSAGLARAGGGGREQLKGELGTGPGGGVRGSRETGGGNIDAMVEGLGEGTAKGVSRTGELVIRNEEPLIEAEEGGTGSGRSQDEVAAIVARHTGAIQSCYQSELRRSPNLQGKLVVRFVIAPQGMVESVTVVSSTLNNESVEKCVVNRIRRWDDFGAIDPKKGKMTIRQIYTFGY